MAVDQVRETSRTRVLTFDHVITCPGNKNAGHLLVPRTNANQWMHPQRTTKSNDRVLKIEASEAIERAIMFALQFALVFSMWRAATQI